MLCDICHKSNATVHLTEIIDDKVVEMHICQKCAQSKAEELSSQPNIVDFLGGLTGLGRIEGNEKTLKCSACGLSYAEFKSKGRLGCEHCYSVFKQQLLPLLKKIHSSCAHYGKTPLGQDKLNSSQEYLKDLQAQLKRAIKLEEYEDAARLRDKIKKIEEV
ncbi:MAG: UvrB/UvrC motif-containing protein [Candidatus Omnitrophica bacterium]|nr:UvrB/UvrC motif-containing protein [Candidatus Omnitrophota bacterium]MDD5430225.1 UvrB/UvrC motif-containing protein [Candidatus Omnitrophota bacterium]